MKDWIDEAAEEIADIARPFSEPGQWEIERNRRIIREAYEKHLRLESRPSAAPSWQRLSDIQGGIGISKGAQDG